MRPEVTSGALNGSHPQGVVYTEVSEPEIRASVLAHAIRLGQLPPVGHWIGFSRQLKEVEADDPAVIDIKAASAIGDKIWCRITITQADIAAAIALINSQRATYREAGGEKISQVLTREPRGER